MSADTSQKLPPRPAPDMSLPEIRDIRIRRVKYAPPKHRHFESRLAKYTEAVEFMVLTAGPIPIRALGPALFVGEFAVTECEAVERMQYRFLAFEIDRLRPGASIAWGWMNDPPPSRKATKFTFRL